MDVAFITCGGSLFRGRSHLATPTADVHPTKYTKPTIRCVQTLHRPITQDAKKPSAKPRVTVEGDSIDSTPFQKAMLGIFVAAASSVFCKLGLEATGPSDILSCVGGLAFSYIFTDFAVGWYHHAVDNYGSENTPIFGYQIAAFQGHHNFPWTITARDIANNLYRLTVPLTPQMLLLLVLPVAHAATAFYGGFLTFILLSQETHRQAHMTRSAPWIRALQNQGIIVKRTVHGEHHRSPFARNYCILSGIWNKPLDESFFFRRVEAIIYLLTGVEPICWDLDKDLKEFSLSLLPSKFRR